MKYPMRSMQLMAVHMEVEAMPQVFNVYCVESCHLEHDRQEVMVLGVMRGQENPDMIPLLAR